MFLQSTSKSLDYLWENAEEEEEEEDEEDDDDEKIPLQKRGFRNQLGLNTPPRNIINQKRRKKTRKERSFAKKIEEKDSSLPLSTSFQRSKSLRGNANFAAGRKEHTKLEHSGNYACSSYENAIKKDNFQERGSKSPPSRTSAQHSIWKMGHKPRPLKTSSGFEDQKKCLWDSLTAELVSKLRERSQRLSVSDTNKNSNKEGGKNSLLLTKEICSEVPSFHLVSSSVPTEVETTPYTDNSSIIGIPPPPPMPKVSLSGYNYATNLFSAPRFTTFQPPDTKTPKPLYHIASDDDNSSSSTTIFRPKTRYKTICKGKRFPEKSRQTSNFTSFIKEHSTNQEKTPSGERKVNGLYERENLFWKKPQQPKHKTNLPFKRGFQYRSLPQFFNSYESESSRRVNFSFISDSDSDSDTKSEVHRPLFRSMESPPYEHLETVQLCHSNLRKFPEGILQIISLRSLNLSWNNISKLPSNFSFIPRLEVLDVSHNQLKIADVDGFKFLRKLQLASNIIENFPKLNAEAYIIFLDLTFNQIWRLPHQNDNIIISHHKDAAHTHSNSKEEIQPRNFQNILKLAQNRLAGCFTFAHLQNVTELDVSDNGITSLEVTSLASLTSLKCSNNAIVTISIHGEALVTLIADKNCITSVRLKGYPRRLRFLDMSRNCLGAVPPWLVSCNKLEYCDVSGNNIDSLPAYVTSGHLADLRVLKANFNKLKALSSSEGLLEQSLSEFERRRICALEILSVHHNQIENLPTKFFQHFLRLRVLNVSRNLLKNFPNTSNPARRSCVVIHPAIQEIYATDNELEDLTPLEACQSLKILHAPFNRISTISQRFCSSCEFLEELVLSGNNISSLPTTILQLRRLSVLRIHLNPIHHLPQLSLLTSLKVIDASHCRLGKVDFGWLVGPSLVTLDVAFNPSIVVDQLQFSKCRSHRMVSMVDTAGEQNRSLPFLDSKYSKDTSDEADSSSHFSDHGDFFSLSDLQEKPKKMASKMTHWKIGFCEAVGKEKSKLTMAQLRIADLYGDGLVGLMAIADGGESLRTASTLMATFPEALKEEKLCYSDLNDALRFSILSCLRQIVIEEGTFPDSYCVAYLTAEGSRCGGFKTRNTANNFLSERTSYSLRLSCYGDISAIVTTNDRAPLVVSSRTKNKSEDLPAECKANGHCSTDKFLNLPDPQTTHFRLTDNHRSLIIASSNLWELIEPSEANGICQNVSDPSLAAKRLLTLAQSYGCKKSLSILVVYLQGNSTKKTNQFSSFSEKIGLNKNNNQTKKSLSNGYLYNSKKNKFLSQQENQFFLEINPRGGTHLEEMENTPSEQSKSKTFSLEKPQVPEFMNRNSAPETEREENNNYICPMDEAEKQNPISSLYYSPFHEIQDSVYPLENESFNCIIPSFEIITPPEGFGDTDTKSIGSDSGFSGNSGEKVSPSSNADLSEQTSLISEMTEEQFKSWEYVVTRNSKILPLKELSSLNQNVKETQYSASVPNLSEELAEQSTKCNQLSEEGEVDSKPDTLLFTPEEPTNPYKEHHHFHKNIFRKSRLAKGAAKLLQNTFSFGNTFKVGNISKLRSRSRSFKRFGSLQNLNYYQNKGVWNTGMPSLGNLKWTEPKPSDEMKERSTFDSMELESRMHHYWNTGITCF